MKIAIVTNGRFHVCDLARELHTLGHDVAFYSMVPPARTERFGLPRRCTRWLGPWLAPVYGAMVAGRGTPLEEATHHALIAGLDLVTSRVLEPCDVLIGMSSMCLRTLEVAHSRYGAFTIVERGSRHILSQRALLERLARPDSKRPVPDWAVHRELAEYALADAIAVPARHVVASFAEHGVSSKLFRNPYGVSLEMFPPTPVPAGPPTVVMTGTWSLQKGCDVLTAAMREIAGARLLHVGTLGDCPVPDEPWFEHHPPVDQAELTHFYARGHVFALASRQEGLSLVQAQALASGLRLVCTDRTGGEDLGELLGVEDRVTVVPHDDVPALRDALEAALASATKAGHDRATNAEAIQRLSWRAYGVRYHDYLTGISTAHTNQNSRSRAAAAERH